MEKKADSREGRDEMRKEKTQCRRKIKNHLSNVNLRAAWQEIKTMAAIDQHNDETRQPISYLFVF